MLAPKSWGQRSVVQRQGASHLVGCWERLFIGVRERLPPVVGEQSTHRYWRPIGTRRSGCHGDHRDCHSTREREYKTPHLPTSHRPPPQTGRSLCGCNAVSYWPMCWNATSRSSWLLLVPYATSRPKRRTRADRAHPSTARSRSSSARAATPIAGRLFGLQPRSGLRVSARFDPRFQARAVADDEAEREDCQCRNSPDRGRRIGPAAHELNPSTTCSG